LSSLISYAYRLLTWEESDKSGIMESLLAPEAVARKPKKKLLDQVPDVTRLKHYSLRTERTYCDWIKLLHPFPPDAAPGPR
jgi:hypothetical protein